MSEDDDDISLSSLSDQEDELKDKELMDDILRTIETLNKVPTSGLITKPDEEFQASTEDQSKTVFLDDLSLIELQVMLNQVSQALEANNSLQSMLLMKEVKLLSLKRQCITARAYRKANKGEMKCDIGRYIVKFKAPYFKNEQNFASYTVVPEKDLPYSAHRYEYKSVQWTKSDLFQLEQSVHTFLSNRAFKEMMKVLPKTYEQKRAIIKKFEALKKASIKTLVGDDFDRIIDWCHIASRLKKNHSPNECQKAWDVFLKPSVNRSKWGVKEKETLKKLALEHNFEDWDAIAKNLGTNRSGYQCFYQYVDVMTKLSEGEWSKAEDEFLINLVKECTYGHKILWHKVSYFFESRSLNQIYRKWKLSSVGKENKAGNFTEEDDRIIIDSLLIKDGDIHRVAQRLNRLSSQIRYRLGQLKNSMTHKYGEFSLEEDKQLMELVEKHGTKSWATIAKFMPARGRVQIRHRFKHIRKMQKAYPNIKLEDFSRTKRTVHMSRKEVNLKYVMNLKDFKEEPGMLEKIGELGKSKKKVLPSAMKGFETSTAEILGEKCELDTLMDKMALAPKGNAGTSKSVKQKGSKTKSGDQGMEAKTSDAPKKRKKVTVKKPGATKPKKFTIRQTKSLKMDLPSDLCPKLVDVYASTSEFIGGPIKPSNSCEGGVDPEINSLLKFRPYKYFEKGNTEWYFRADRTDPYYNEVLKVVECPENAKKEDRELKDAKEWLLPPCLTSFEGFYNLLVDLGFSQEDLEVSDEALDEQLRSLYCAEDGETVAAVNRWKQRLKSLFLWPAVMSDIELDHQEGIDSPRELEQRNVQTLNESERIQLAEELKEIADDDLRAIMEEQLGMMNDNADRLSTLALQDDTAVQLKSEPSNKSQGEPSGSCTAQSFTEAAVEPSDHSDDSWEDSGEVIDENDPPWTQSRTKK